jgi:hypothetical protein
LARQRSALGGEVEAACIILKGLASLPQEQLIKKYYFPYQLFRGRFTPNNCRDSSLAVVSAMGQQATLNGLWNWLRALVHLWPER